MRPCFVDLDGVLVDFIGGACNKLGKPPLDPYPPGLWEIWKVLHMEEADFWTRIDDYFFWSSLPWMPDGYSILQAAEKAFGEEHVFLLSSPAYSPNCWSGKATWVKQQLPQYSRRLILTPAKHLLAATGGCLVDDSEKNVNTWHGGTPILVPRPWNRHHAMAGNALEITRRNLQDVAQKLSQPTVPEATNIWRKYLLDAQAKIREAGQSIITASDLLCQSVFQNAPRSEGSQQQKPESLWVIPEEE